VASIERTAYPRFKRFLSARELHVFYTPQPGEVPWARGADFAAGGSAWAARTVWQHLGEGEP